MRYTIINWDAVEPFPAMDGSQKEGVGDGGTMSSNHNNNTSPNSCPKNKKESRPKFCEKTKKVSSDSSCGRSCRIEYCARCGQTTSEMHGKCSNRMSGRGWAVIAHYCRGSDGEVISD